MSDSDGDDESQYGDPLNDDEQGGAEEEKQGFSGMVMRQFEPENMDVDN